jgi:hypothetical protein
MKCPGTRETLCDIKQSNVAGQIRTFKKVTHDVMLHDNAQPFLWVMKEWYKTLVPWGSRVTLGILYTSKISR